MNFTQVQTFNNNGLFRTKRYSTARQKKKKFRRLFIRRSKINPYIVNNSSSPYDDTSTIHYCPQATRMKRKLITGAGDERLTPVSQLTNQYKQIDFTELEQIFDNAIQNKVPIELYKEKPRTTNDILLTQEETLRQQSKTKLEPISDTRIELSNRDPVNRIHHNFIHKIKQHKILSAITATTLSALIGFLSVLMFIK